MTTISHYEADDLIISLDVTFDPASGITSLTGGSAEAVARSDSGTIVAANSVTITSDTNIRASWAENTLPQGIWAIQIRATVSSVTQTLADIRLTSLPSVAV